MADGAYCMECDCVSLYCTCDGDLSDFEWNDGYYIEAMDRLHVFMNMVDEHLTEHPAIKKAGAEKNVDRALGEMMKAYQKVGEVSYYSGEGNE